MLDSKYEKGNHRETEQLNSYYDDCIILFGSQLILRLLTLVLEEHARLRIEACFDQGLLSHVT